MVLTHDRSVSFLGVDLGQSQDYTALAVLELRERATEERDSATWEPLIETSYTVRGVKRVPLGTRYPEVVSQIGELIAKLPGKITLVVDATGVGAPVVDMMRENLRGVPLIPVVLTGGSGVRCENGVYRVPKKDLVHGLVLLFQEGKLRIPEQLPGAAMLRAELANMRVKISPEGHAGYEAWREGQHDDLVLALALACWQARRSVSRSLEGRRPILW